MKYSQTELAWAAGLFDGEGSTGRGTKQGIRISIGQRDRFVLDRFQAAVGCGKVHGPDSQDKFNFRANIPETILIAKLLWPWLSPIKKRQFIYHWNNYTANESRRYGYKEKFAV